MHGEEAAIHRHPIFHGLSRPKAPLLSCFASAHLLWASSKQAAACKLGCDPGAPKIAWQRVASHGLLHEAASEPPAATASRRRSPQPGTRQPCSAWAARPTAVEAQQPGQRRRTACCSAAHSRLHAVFLNPPHGRHKVSTMKRHAQELLDSVLKNPDATPDRIGRVSSPCFSPMPHQPAVPLGLPSGCNLRA